MCWSPRAVGQVSLLWGIVKLQSPSHAYRRAVGVSIVRLIVVLLESVMPLKVVLLVIQLRGGLCSGIADGCPSTREADAWYSRNRGWAGTTRVP